MYLAEILDLPLSIIWRDGVGLIKMMGYCYLSLLQTPRKIIMGRVDYLFLSEYIFIPPPMPTRVLLFRRLARALSLSYFKLKVDGLNVFSFRSSRLISYSTCTMNQLQANQYLIMKWGRESDLSVSNSPWTSKLGLRSEEQPIYLPIDRCIICFLGKVFFI
jgi:hypothetical protein